jgi:hypothetical protein
LLAPKKKEATMPFWIRAASGLATGWGSVVVAQGLKFNVVEQVGFFVFSISFLTVFQSIQMELEYIRKYRTWLE